MTTSDLDVRALSLKLLDAFPHLEKYNVYTMCSKSISCYEAFFILSPNQEEEGKLVPIKETNCQVLYLRQSPPPFFEQTILIHCWAWHWGQTGVRNKPPLYMIIKVFIGLNCFKVVLCQSHLWMRPCNQTVFVSFNKHRCGIASFQWLPPHFINILQS